MLTSALDECYWSVLCPGQPKYVLEKKAVRASEPISTLLLKGKPASIRTRNPPVVRPIGKSAAAGSCRAELGPGDCKGGTWSIHNDTVEDQESGMLECGSRVAGFVFPDVSNECTVFIVTGWGVQDPATWHYILEDLAPPQGTPVCARTRNKTWGTTASRRRINIQCTTIVCGTVDPLYSRLWRTWTMNLLQQRQPSHAPSRPRFKATIRSWGLVKNAI